MKNKRSYTKSDTVFTAAELMALTSPAGRAQGFIVQSLDRHGVTWDWIGEPKTQPAGSVEFVGKLTDEEFKNCHMSAYLSEMAGDFVAVRDGRKPRAEALRHAKECGFSGRVAPLLDAYLKREQLCVPVELVDF